MVQGKTKNKKTKYCIQKEKTPTFELKHKFCRTNTQTPTKEIANQRQLNSLNKTEQKQYNNNVKPKQIKYCVTSLKKQQTLQLKHKHWRTTANDLFKDNQKNEDYTHAYSQQCEKPKQIKYHAISQKKTPTFKLKHKHWRTTTNDLSGNNKTKQVSTRAYLRS